LTGYLQLPADPRKVAIELADFTPIEHASAIAKAIETIGLIRAGSFAPGSVGGRGPNRDDDPFRFILQTPVFAGGDGEEDA
jgi:hypothetical protein